MKTDPLPLRLIARPFVILAMLWLAGLMQTKAEPFQQFPDPPAAITGSVVVKLTPSNIGARWHFVGEKVWRNPDTPVTELALGIWEIEFLPVPGYIQPISKKIHLTEDKTTISLNLNYFESPGGVTGHLKVLIKPDELAAQSVSATKRAQWRLLGEDDDKWRDSGDARKLIPGSYLVETKPVTGKSATRSISVKVLENKQTLTTAVYFDQDSTTGTLPEVLDFPSINDSSANLPYAYVGQIRTDASEGTGCVVLRNTVATAAHVIFDENRFDYFGGLQWLFQRHPGSLYPVPQIPRRVGILSSYADQREIDDSPGELTARARNCDIAALFFPEPPGRNGWSGYQFSDSDSVTNPNEYLTSSRLKTLASYPLEEISNGNRGKMHANPPSNITFIGKPDFDEATDNNLYFTNDITSAAGAAGAPLFVKSETGIYDCVGIYMGSSLKTDVRSFTSDVDDLFFWANNDGGGPNGGITQVDGPGGGGVFAAGALKINIKPSSARWKLGGNSTARASGSTVSNLLPGTYTVNFTRVNGFQKQPPVSAIVSGGQITTLDIKYIRTGPATRITTLENNAIVSRNGFHVRGTASDPNGIRKYQVKITGKADEILLPGRDYFTGEVAKGSITIQMRAQNRAGVWGEFTGIAVEAK
jgi:hypothetical protein